MSMFENIGGIANANAFKTNIQDIIEDKWFPAIESEWPTNSIERCALMCGSKFNIIGSQNADVAYRV